MSDKMKTLAGPARAVAALKLGQNIQRKMVPTIEKRSDV
jgi:hypothetical protein